MILEDSLNSAISAIANQIKIAMSVFAFGRDAVPLIPNCARMISIPENTLNPVLFHQTFASTRIE